jgi:hypothetical protein
MSRPALGMATLINANETLQAGLQVAIVGDPDNAATEALVRAVYGQSLPDRVLQTVRDSDALPTAIRPGQARRAGQIGRLRLPRADLFAADIGSGRVGRRARLRLSGRRSAQQADSGAP